MIVGGRQDNRSHPDRCAHRLTQGAVEPVAVAEAHRRFAAVAVCDRPDHGRPGDLSGQAVELRQCLNEGQHRLDKRVRHHLRQGTGDKLVIAGEIDCRQAAAGLAQDLAEGDVAMIARALAEKHRQGRIERGAERRIERWGGGKIEAFQVGGDGLGHAQAGDGAG